MPSSLKAQVQAAVERCQRLHDRIYACAPNNITPFSECYALAPSELQQQLDDAYSKLITLERAAVSAGKAWRTTHGILWWYR